LEQTLSTDLGVEEVFREVCVILRTLGCCVNIICRYFGKAEGRGGFVSDDELACCREEL
jgi:hypothetical protein